MDDLAPFYPTLIPLAFFCLSAWLMWLNPLSRGAHDRIVRELAN